MKQMKQLKQQYPMSLLAGTCCTAIVLALSSVGVAQQAVATATVPATRQATKTAPASLQLMPVAAKPVAEEGQEAASGKRGGEGVKVHGHWVITVKNADGTVAAHRDFQNSLITSGSQAYGSQVLTALLSGNAIPGPPALALIQKNSSDETTECTSSANNCAIFAAPDSLATLYSTYTSILTTQTGLSAAAAFSGAVGIVLSGNFAAPGTGTFSFQAVESFFPLCIPTTASYLTSGTQPLFTGTATFDNGNTAPNNCTASYFSGFGRAGSELLLIPPLTFTLITDSMGNPSPLTLAPSQTITIAFTLTFS